MRKQIYLDRYQLPRQGLDTEYIQDALNRCRDGGGEVILSTGTWNISSIRMYSDTTLRLLSGCHLIGTTDYSLYQDWGVDSTLGFLRDPEIVRLWQLPPDYVNAMITAVDAENVAVIGELASTINGQNCSNPFGQDHFRGPMGMVFCRCRQITLRGYTFIRCGNWAHEVDSCQDLLMDNVHIRGGHHGVGIYHSRSIRIENCDLRPGGDCVAGYGNENIQIRDTCLNSPSSCLRLGARNLFVRGCRFWGPGEYPNQSTGQHNTLSALAYYSLPCDPCPPSTNWVISDCSFEDLDSFALLNHGSAWDQNGSPLRDFTVENCTMRDIETGSLIRSTTPMDAHFSHVRVHFRRGIPENGACESNPQVTFHLRDVHIL